MSREGTKNGGVSFTGLLVILLIGLKLSHQIYWSWIWVFAPVWIPILIIALSLLFAAIFGAMKRKRSR